MEFIKSLEQTIKEEMKNFIGDIEGLKWEEMFFDSGEVDFHDHEMKINFWNGSYGESYYFLHDYENNVGSLHKYDEEEKPVEVKSWGSHE